jgi:hypothetical protein
MNIDYCSKKCPIGIKACKELLAESESVFDARIDFELFTVECFKTCPYKDEHKTEENK